MSASTKEVKDWSKTPSDPEWDTPRFLLGDAAAASGIELTVLKAWLARGGLDLDRHTLEASRMGSSRFFSLRTILGIALMAELVLLGVPPRRSAAHARISVQIDLRD